MSGIDNPTTLEHCLQELILNSLKAQATAIAVRIHFGNQIIQVVDNGFGITKKELRRLGHYTAKKGSLIRIKEISSFLIVMSKSQFATKTYGKCYSNGKEQKLQKIDDRPTSGTTVSVTVSKKFCNWKEDSFAIKFIIICLSLMNRQVSFSVRDDMRGSILLRIGKFQKPHQLLKVIFEQYVSSAKIQSIKTQISEVKITIFWGVECTEFRKIQQVLLNLKPVNCPSLKKTMIRIITQKYYPLEENKKLCLQKIFFLVYIECPDSDYNMYVKNTKWTVDFHQIDQIVDSIEKFFRKTRPNDISKTFVYKSIVTKKMSHPFERILGVMEKTSFFTKVSRHKFQKNLTKNSVKNEIKYLRKIQKISRFSRKAFNDINRDIAVPQNFNPEDTVLIKEEKDSQKSIENKNRDESLFSTPSIIRNIHVSSKTDVNKEPNIFNLSVNHDEKPQNDKRNSSKEFESFSVKEQDYDDYESWNSQGRKEKSCVTSEFTIISQYWPSDCAETVEINRKSQKNVVEDKKCFETAVETVDLEIPDKNLPIVKEYQYDNHGVFWISQRCNEKISNSTEDMYDIGLSQWSDWNYEVNTKKFDSQKSCEIQPVFYKRFRFLPLQLHALLPFLNEKLIYRNPSDDVKLPLNIKLNYRRQDFDVRACTRRPLELRLEMESLKSMKVLNQVNHEFIVALTKQDEKKLLVIIDQHAMHERIRYENLLGAYKRDQKNQLFISVTLNRPIIITDLSTSSCNILSSNHSLLVRYGLNLAFRNETTLMIFTVPRCFINKTYRADNTEVEIAVRKLLQELLDNINANGTTKLLPFTIHDAIASEACHGAIKFGDSLTSKQCKSLIALWIETEAPNRCAHGRPSVVPLLEIPSHTRDKYEHHCQSKLNFASLLKYRRSSEKPSSTALRYHPYVTMAKKS